MAFSKNLVVAFALVASLFGVACDVEGLTGPESVSTAGTSGGGGDAEKCEDGDSRACECADGNTVGTQFCGTDGWKDECVCEDAPDLPVCIPGSTAGCDAACGTGQEGSQECASDGMSYGSCQCKDKLLCTPGAVSDCSSACDDDQTGSQKCNSAGSGYGSCECRDKTDNDKDGDGEDSKSSGGPDCDDTDPSVNSGAVESGATCSDGKDNDCDNKVDSADSGCAACVPNETSTSTNVPSCASGSAWRKCNADSQWGDWQCISDGAGGSTGTGGATGCGGATGVGGDTSVGGSSNWKGNYVVFVQSDIQTWDFFALQGVMKCTTATGNVQLLDGLAGCSFAGESGDAIEFNVRATLNSADLFGAYEPWENVCPDGQRGCAQLSGVYYSRWYTTMCRVGTDGSVSACVKVAGKSERLTDANSDWNGRTEGGANFTVTLQ